MLTRHVFPGDLEQAAMFGVTTVLDMMADPAQAARLRHHAAATHESADLRSAGTAATVPNGYGWYLVEMGLLPPFPTIAHPGQAADFVAQRLSEGSDYLKVLIDDGATVGMPTPMLGLDTVRELVAAAHAHGRRVVAHALTADTAYHGRRGRCRRARTPVRRPPGTFPAGRPRHAWYRRDPHPVGPW